MEPDLFTPAHYPQVPGFRKCGTSQDAAQAIAPIARTLREQVFSLLKDNALTADEAASALNKSVLSIRPRVTELLRLGKIEDAGATRRNSSGIRATVWTAI